MRFETQPTYTMPGEQESLSRWRSGESKPAGHNAGWHKTVRGAVSAGKSIGRVRVVQHPLTEYQRYQLEWGIPGNVDAGEDIRILDLNFNPDGTLLNLDRRENPDLRVYQRWQRTALEHAVPFGAYART